MSTSLIICLVISILTIAAYVWNKFPIGAIGCASMALYLLTGCVTPNNVLSNIGNSNVVMVACMFVISEGFKRTQAVKLVAGTVRKVSHGNCLYPLCDEPGWLRHEEPGKAVCSARYSAHHCECSVGNDRLSYVN